MEVSNGGNPRTTTQADLTQEPFVFLTLRYDPELVNSVENTAVSGHQPCPFYMLEHHYTRLQVAKWSLATWAKQSRPINHKDANTYDEHAVRIGPSSANELCHGLLNAVETWRKGHPQEEPESLRIKFRLYASGRMHTEIFTSIARLPHAVMFPPSFGSPTDHKNAAWTVTTNSEPTKPTESTMIKTHDRSAYDRARANAGILTYAEKREVLLWTAKGNVLDGSISTPYFYRDGKWVTPASSTGGQQGVSRRWALNKGICVEGVVPLAGVVPGEIMFLSNAIKGFFPATFESLEFDGSKREQ